MPPAAVISATTLSAGVVSRPSPAALPPMSLTTTFAPSLASNSAALPSQLGHDLVDHTHAAGADGMAEGLQPATGVDRDITVESSAPFFNELGAFALFGKPEVLIVGDLSPGKTVVHLSDVDLFER